MAKHWTSKIMADNKRHTIGDRVEMFDGTCQGTIDDIVNEYMMVIKWDDNTIGHVHPLDVKYIS